MLFGNAVQSVLAGIASLESFVQFGPGTQVLVTGGVKFHTHFRDHFLNVHCTTSTLSSSLPLSSFGGGASLGLSSSSSADHVFFKNRLSVYV